MPTGGAAPSSGRVEDRPIEGHTVAVGRQHDGIVSAEVGVTQVSRFRFHFRHSGLSGASLDSAV
jgi:hypothetical protein